MANGLTPFEVTAVESDFVHVLPSGGRQVRRIQRRDVELARRLQRTGTALTAGELIQGGVGMPRAASIVGILHAPAAPYRPPASIRKE